MGLHWLSNQYDTAEKTNTFLQQMKCCIAQRLLNLSNRADCGIVEEEEWYDLFRLQGKLNVLINSLDRHGEYYVWTICLSGNQKNCTGTLSFNGDEVVEVTIPELASDTQLGDYDAAAQTVETAVREFFAVVEPRCGVPPLYKISREGLCITVKLHPYYVADAYKPEGWGTEMCDWGFDFALSGGTCIPISYSVGKLNTDYNSEQYGEVESSYIFNGVALGIGGGFSLEGWFEYDDSNEDSSDEFTILSMQDLPTRLTVSLLTPAGTGTSEYGLKVNFQSDTDGGQDLTYISFIGSDTPTGKNHFAVVGRLYGIIPSLGGGVGIRFISSYNGVVVTNRTETGSPAKYDGTEWATNTTRVGESVTTGSLGWSGSLHDIRVWDGRLSDSFIALIAESPCSQPPSELLLTHWWKFDETSGGTAADSGALGEGLALQNYTAPELLEGGGAWGPSFACEVLPDEPFNISTPDPTCGVEPLRVSDHCLPLATLQGYVYDLQQACFYDCDVSNVPPEEYVYVAESDCGCGGGCGCGCTDLAPDEVTVP